MDPNIPRVILSCKDPIVREKAIVLYTSSRATIHDKTEACKMAYYANNATLIDRDKVENELRYFMKLFTWS